MYKIEYKINNEVFSKKFEVKEFAETFIRILARHRIEVLRVEGLKDEEVDLARLPVIPPIEEYDVDEVAI